MLRMMSIKFYYENMVVNKVSAEKLSDEHAKNLECIIDRCKIYQLLNP